MPEIAFVFLIGSFVTLLTGVLLTFMELAKYNSKRYLLLQINLQKINLRWNDLEGSTEVYTADAGVNELNKVKTTYILISLLGGILSWLGFLILVIIFISIKKLIVNRIEKKIFSSELVLVDLESERVSELVQDIIA